MNNILLTGASGFLGGNLVNFLKNDFHISLVVRNKTQMSFPDFPTFTTGDFSGITDFTECLQNIDCVIHTAALAHEGNNSDPRFLESMHEVNVLATLQLAKQAAENSVKRFIFISSIGVNGPKNEYPFSYRDKPNPSDPYSTSKYRAEAGLIKIGKLTGMEIVIIRPPLICGDGARGNFKKFVKLASSNLPLPLGAFSNKRNFVSIENLIDLIRECVVNDNAANQIFLICDDDVVTVSQLLKLICKAKNTRTFLIPVPVSILYFCFFLIRKKQIIEKLSCQLLIDNTHTKKTLNWEPLITLKEGIRRWFTNQC